MYEITLKVNGNGTLDTFQKGRLLLGTLAEKERLRLAFDIDPTVEGTYQYVKFYHPECTLLQRITNKKVIVAENILQHSGVWLISFISSNGAINTTRPTGSYLFMTVPIEAYVNDGILGFDIHSQQELRIAELESEVQNLKNYSKGIIEMNYTSLIIPDYVSSIGNYFMYNLSFDFDELRIGKNVLSIGSYSFYGCNISRIRFEEGSHLTALCDCAFSHVSIVGEITFPASLTNYGHYAFQGGTVGAIRFQEGSNLTTLLPNSFNNVTITNSLSLPSSLTKIATNGYVIRNCRIHYIWIPNSLTNPIPQTAFYEAQAIEYIQLEDGFNVSANFTNCTGLPRNCLVEIMYSLADRTGQSSLSITFGATNLAKLTEDDICIATEKNWTVS